MFTALAVFQIDVPSEKCVRGIESKFYCALMIEIELGHFMLLCPGYFAINHINFQPIQMEFKLKSNTFIPSQILFNAIPLNPRIQFDF